MTPHLLKLCVPRKRHTCRICGQRIQKGEPCERWTGVEQGEGWWTCHAHPECLDQTVTDKWNNDDWDFPAWESGLDRPAKKRECFVCRKESVAWIALKTRPRYVCSPTCLADDANAKDLA